METFKSGVGVWVVAIGAAALAGAPGARAQEGSGLPTTFVLRAAMPETVIDGDATAAVPKIELTAGKEDKRAALKLAGKLGAGTQWETKFSTAWDSDAQETALATLDGLASGMKLEFAFTHSLYKAPMGASLDAACAAAPAALTALRAAGSGCDVRSLETLTDRALLAEVARAYFAAKPWYPFVSVKFAAGEDEFKYLDAALAKQSTEKAGWSVGASGGVLNVPGQWSVHVGYRREQAYQNDAASKATLCTPIVGTTALSCSDGFLRPPVRKDKDIGTVEWRQRWTGLEQWKLNVASTLRLSYDLEDEVFGVNAPVYLVGDGNGGLAGGVQLGWVDPKGEESDWRVAVFVSNAFQLH